MSPAIIAIGTQKIDKRKAEKTKSNWRFIDKVGFSWFRIWADY
jgi:hypothetical protein